MSTRSRSGFSLLTSLLLTALLAGCSSQGEGQRCDAANGNLDCQAGLLCRPIGGAVGYDLCCPPADQTPSAPACINVLIITPADASTDVASNSDDGAANTSETSTSDDASNDVGPDAAAPEADLGETGADL